jgi:hypothetical protein
MQEELRYAGGVEGHVPLQQCVDWVKYDVQERFTALNQFNNTRQLGNAFRSNPAQVSRSTGLKLVVVGGQSYVKFSDPAGQ